MKKHTLFILIIFLMFFADNLYAQKTVFSREFPRIMTSVRAMGMGNAFYGVSDDKYASFYNPAGIAMNKSYWSVDIVPMTIGVNNNLFDNSQDLSNVFSGGGLDTGGITQTLNGMMGQYNNISPISFFPAFTYKNWTGGIFFNSYVNLLTYNNVMPTVAAKVHADAGAVVTYAHSFLKDKSLHVGVSLIGIFRMAYTDTYSSVELVSIDTNSLINRALSNQGWGLLASVGVMYELPWLRKELNARVGLSFNEFGYTSFAPGIDDIMPTLNLSFAVSPGWDFITSNVVLDFNDLIFMAGDDKSFGKRVNFGIEVGFWNRLFVRTGLHQGYWTAGLGVNAWALKINYAYYTEEMGAYAGQYPDRRHVLEVVIGWDQMTENPNNKIVK